MHISSRHLARKATFHISQATNVRPNLALRGCTIPRGPIVRKLHRIVVHAFRRYGKHGRQRAIDIDSLARRSVRPVEFAYEFVLIVIDLDSEAVVIREAEYIGGAFVFLILQKWSARLR